MKRLKLIFTPTKWECEFRIVGFTAVRTAVDALEADADSDKLEAVFSNLLIREIEKITGALRNEDIEKIKGLKCDEVIYIDSKWKLESGDDFVAFYKKVGGSMKLEEISEEISE